MVTSFPTARSSSHVPQLHVVAMPAVIADEPTAPARAYGDSRAPAKQASPAARARVDGLAAVDGRAGEDSRDARLRGFAAGLATGGVIDAKTRDDFAALVSHLRISGARDVNDLVQQVLRESYLASTEDLNFYAQKVSFYNDLKKKIRTDISALRTALADNAGLPDSKEKGGTPIRYGLDAIDTDRFKTLADGTKVDNPNYGKPRYPGAAEAVSRWASIPDTDDQGRLVATREDASSLSLSPTKEGLDAYVQDLESQLNSVGDDAQLANVDLQNMLQKQQQTLQMMSNISKTLHDTAMAVLRKISG